MAYTVYLAGTAAPSTGSTLTVTITGAVAAGDTIHLSATTGGSVGVNVWGISDTQGNVWNIQQQSINSQGMWQFWCQDAIALTTSDTISVLFSNNTNVKEIAVIGIHGAAATGTLVDVSAQAGGTSTSPSVTTATLARSTELAIVTFSNGNGGGAPTLAGGWTQIAQVHTCGNAWLTVAYQALAATTAVTASATITSTTWAAQVMTIAAQGALPAVWLQSVAGAPTSNQFQVVSKMAGAYSRPPESRHQRGAHDQTSPSLPRRPRTPTATSGTPPRTCTPAPSITTRSPTPRTAGPRPCTARWGSARPSPRPGCPRRSRWRWCPAWCRRHPTPPRSMTG